MDLNTLPQEMLANILKYKGYKNVSELRRVNSYIDSTSKRYMDLTKIPVERLEISRELGDSTNCKLSLHLQRKFALRFGFIKNVYEFQCSIETIMEKITSIGKIVAFTSVVYLNNIELGYFFYSTVEANQGAFKKCKTLDLYRCIITLSIDYMKKLLAMLPNLNTIQLNTVLGNCNSEVLFNAEVLGGGHWKNLYLGTKADNIICPQFNDEFLMKVVIYCQKFVIPYYEFRTHFTLEGVIKMIKKKSFRNQQPSEIDIGTLELGNTSIHELENILDSLYEVNVYNKEEDAGEYHYTVQIGNSTLSVTFVVMKPQDND